MDRYAKLLPLTFAVLLTFAASCIPRLSGDRNSRGARTSSSAASSDAAAPAPPPRPAFVSPELKRTREELLGHIVTETTGFKKGAESQGSLDPFQPVEVKLKRGTCYKVAFVLDEGVEFSEHAKHSVSFEVAVEGQPTLKSATAFGPGGVVHIGCPNDVGTARVDMVANWGSARDKSRIHDLGSGGFKATVFTKSISEKELAALNERKRIAAEEQAVATAEFRRKEEARKDREREEARERSWKQEQSKNRCQQCSTTFSLCTASCGSQTGCRGRCQSQEWDCKKSCR
jgi:hypothetical protein